MQTTSKSLCISFVAPQLAGCSTIHGRARRHVKRYAGPHGALVNAHCLYRFDEPVSPHLAADMAAEKEGSRVSFCDAHTLLPLNLAPSRTSSCPPTMPL
jgi:hypothetical protein